MLQDTASSSWGGLFGFVRQTGFDRGRALRADDHKMFGVVAADQIGLVTRIEHQCFDDRQPACAVRRDDAGQSVFARRHPGHAQKSEHQNQCAEVTGDLDHVHLWSEEVFPGPILGASTLIAR